LPIWKNISKTKLEPIENPDRFDEQRVGLDHLSFRVSSRHQMERALALFEQHNIIHGEIKDMRPIPIYVLAFRDSDNIQLELTAMYELPLLIKIFSSVFF
jgi:glyoxylase I family protein